VNLTVSAARLKENSNPGIENRQCEFAARIEPEIKCC